MSNGDGVIDDHLRNRAAWDAGSDAYQAQHGDQLRRAADAWGLWSLPEADLNVLGDVRDRDVLEYGCGAAHWSIALARRGARCTGLDNSSRQLAHARRAAAEAGVDIAFVHAPAEATGLPAASFDIVFSDHGAMTFAPPERTIPEAARLLRPGGILAFSCEHPLHASAWSEHENAVSRSLHAPYFELDRLADGDGSVSFVRTISGYFTLLTENGFTIETVLEPRPAPDAHTTYDMAPRAWARDFPAELLIGARR